MTESVITINGRILIEPQARVVRAAIALANGDMAGFDFDLDRLEEVTAMLVPTERQQQERVLVAMNKPRRDRILQLAGIPPESATAHATALAEGYAAQKGLAIDEAATRLRRALESAS